MGKSSGSSQRPVTEEEKRLWDSQAENLDMLTKIAEEQYNLSAEDRNYYETVFREGSDTEAKNALAKLKSQITGYEVTPDQIQDVSIDSLLRDTILNATPEFQEQAKSYIESANQLTSKYGTDVTGLSDTFAKSITDMTTKYQEDLGLTSQAMGTADADILAQTKGQAYAGISSGFSEARKQMEADLARRGLGSSGVEANILAQNYQQEAMSKGMAGSQAYTTAIQQSDARRLQQAQLGEASLQAGVSGLSTAYQANLGGVQNVYGVTSANDYQNFQLNQAATLQGISGLQQLAQAGTGVYAGSQNYLEQASRSAGQAATTAGSSANSLGSLNTQYYTAQQQADASGLAGIGTLVGTLGAAYIKSSDKRLKTNIKFKEVRNGFNIYTWDWVEGFDGGYNEGVIAQEVLETNPEAVSMVDGFYMVNYDMLGVEV